MTILSQLLQPIWEIAKDPIVVSTNETDPGARRTLYVNAAFLELTGYSREEAVGQLSNFLNGPDSDPSIVEESEMQLQTGLPHEYTLLQYRKDGSTYRCDITRAPLFDLDGATEYVISMYKVEPENSSTVAESQYSKNESVPLTIPVPLREFSDGKLPSHLPSHPELDALLDLWNEVRSARALPERDDFSLKIVNRWVSHLSIALVLPDGRFQFRLFGSDLSSVYGRDLTNCFLDELAPLDLWSVITQHYRAVVDTAQPLFAPVSVSNGRWYNEVSRLLLPLSGNGEVNFVMGADYRRDLN